MDINEKNFWAKVDKTETCWNWTAFIDQGYGVFGVRVEGKPVPRRAHRISYTLAHGPIPEGLMVDHICHNLRCVNPDHLRLATNKENQEHRLTASANSKSGVLGVSWHKNTKKWRAVVTHAGRYIHIGYFDTVVEAEAAVKAKRIQLFTRNDIDRKAS
jgi:hypothetical protein